MIVLEILFKLLLTFLYMILTPIFLIIITFMIYFRDYISYETGIVYFTKTYIDGYRHIWED